MQTGVEIHLHQGKPEHVPRTRTVSARRPQWLITRGQLLERLFEQGPNYTLGTDSSSSECTTRHAQTSDDSSSARKARGSLGQARYVLQASGIALRRTEEERAEAFFPLRGTTTAADLKRDARAGHRKTAL